MSGMLATAHGAPPESRDGAFRIRALVPALFLVSAFLPLLALYAHMLWESPRYQFFPLVLVGAALLIWRRTRALGILEPAEPRRARVLLAFCWGWLALAGLLMSPRLGAAASITTLGVIAYSLGGRKLARAIVPALTLLLVIITPPGWLDGALTQGLQRLASQGSFALLDVLGIYFVPSGNAIDVDGKLLIIEQACSGIHSLFSVLACAVFYVFWNRYSWLRAAFVITAAVAWVLLGNAVRIATVAWAYSKLHVDLSTGLPHDLLSLSTLILSLCFIASTDCLYGEISLACGWAWENLILGRDPWQTEMDEADRLAGGVDGSQLPGGESPDGPANAAPLKIATVDAASDSTDWPELSRTVLGQWQIGPAFGGLALLMIVWLWPCLLAIFPQRNDLNARLETALMDATFPSHFGPIERLRDSTAEPQFDRETALVSRSWSYRFGPHQLLARVDFGFRGWHFLTSCYEGIGWQMERQEVQTGGPAAMVQADFRKPAGPCGYLLFRVYDLRGNPLLPIVADEPTLSPNREWLDRLAVWREEVRRSLTERFLLSGQVQVFVESERPLTPAEQEQVRLFYEAVCRGVVDAISSTRRPAG
jgi:exosortase